MKLFPISFIRLRSTYLLNRRPESGRLNGPAFQGFVAARVQGACCCLFVVALLLVGLLPASLAAMPEIKMRLQYPQQLKDVILTGVDGQQIVFRPVGTDRGGRAYLKFDELLRQRGSLNFIFPQAYYDAIEQLEGGQALQALPVIREHAKPFVDYMQLSGLPGNLLPTVLSYLDALTAAAQWREATDLAIQIPLQLAPSRMLERIGQLALALDDVGQSSELERVHRHILSARPLSESQLGMVLELANAWRARADYVRAFNLYRKVQTTENVHQTRARLWVAYCSFYLGHDLVPTVFLENLPEMDVSADGYSLRELIRARLSLREENFSAAMRYAAAGKTYANATDPWYPELLYTLATVYARIDMPQAAIAALRELSISFPASPWAAASLQDLEDLTQSVSEL